MWTASIKPRRGIDLSRRLGPRRGELSPASTHCCFLGGAMQRNCGRPAERRLLLHARALLWLAADALGPQRRWCGSWWWCGCSAPRWLRLEKVLKNCYFRVNQTTILTVRRCLIRP